MIPVPLTNSDKVALVDDCDFDEVSAYTWALHVKGYAYSRFWNGEGYTTVYMHRLLVGAVKGDGMEADHWDHGGLNNQRHNIRLATKSQNKWNMKIPTRKGGKSSRFKGVHFAKDREKWVAGIGLSGRTKYIGIFEHEEEAAKAYNIAAVQHFGEFACLNPL